MLRFEPIVRSWSGISRTLKFAPARRPHARRRFTLERLEDRAMLSTVALTVNTLADDPSGPTSGQTTLRDAINKADTGTGTQYVINIAVKGTIDLTSALPALKNNIVIRGPGASKLTVQRDPNAVPFSVFTVASGVTVSLSGMTIAGGDSAGVSAGVGSNGGGIDNSGTLTVSNSVLSNNSAGSNLNIGVGGGIYNEQGGIATVNDSIFTSNFASAAGGGIYNVGTAIVNDSIFINNSTNYAGGGIYNWDFGIMTVSGSTFTNNTADLGGGIYNAISGMTTVKHSLFTSNSAGDGGGIYNTGGPGSVEGTVMVSDNAFTNNSAYGSGGGIFNNGGTVTVRGDFFIGNSANVNGGGIDNEIDSIAMVINSVFISNSAYGDISGVGPPLGVGGGIFNSSDSAVTVIDSIFADNSAIDGGGIYNLGTLINTKNVFSDNTGGDINKWGF